MKCARARFASVALGLSVAVLASIALTACERVEAARAERAHHLEPSKPLEATLDLAASPWADFYVDVPKDAVLVRWKLVARRVELDLRVRAGASVGDDQDEADFHVSTDGGEAELAYDRFSDPAVHAGRCFARVEWPFEARPRTVSERLERVTFSIEAQVVATRVDGALTIDAPVHGRLDSACGDFRAYTIDVPEGVRTLRFDVADATGDLDLFARHGGQFLVLDDSVRFSQHAFGRETLVIANADGTPIESGTWHVEVVDAFAADHAVQFTLYARLAAEPPIELLAFPAIPKSLGGEPLGRALASVVELTIDDSSGSGTLLTPDGWILSNAHVVKDLGGATARDVVVALTLDPEHPAVELFRAEVRQIDEQRDMALLHVTRGFFGQELPRDLSLPCVEVDLESAPHIGDSLTLVGYPSTGGQGSRVTISATRGIVSGFDAAEFGSILKTDAEITSGNSGGAALDQRGRLIGIPTSTVENGSGQIGYVHPLRAWPSAWRELVFGARPPK